MIEISKDQLVPLTKAPTEFPFKCFDEDGDPLIVHAIHNGFFITSWCDRNGNFYPGKYILGDHYEKPREVIRWVNGYMLIDGCIFISGGTYDSPEDANRAGCSSRTHIGKLTQTVGSNVTTIEWEEVK